MEKVKEIEMVCIGCMKKHAVQIIRVHDRLTFKTIPVEFDAEYCYCENTDITYATEQQLNRNDIAMKDAYREKMGLLTSDQIIEIRQKYGMNQTELSRVLGWPDDTIKRYESHQVQDIKHDKILRKIDSDFKWFQHVKFPKDVPLPVGYFDTPNLYKDPPECHINIRKLSNYITETGKDLSELTKEEIAMFFTTE